MSFNYGKLNRFAKTRVEKRNQPREKMKGRGNRRKEEKKRNRKKKTEKIQKKKRKEKERRTVSE